MEMQQSGRDSVQSIGRAKREEGPNQQGSKADAIAKATGVDTDRGASHAAGTQDGNKTGPRQSRELAWLQVLGSFCLYFNTYVPLGGAPWVPAELGTSAIQRLNFRRAGIISSFGIYQVYYETELGYRPTQASLIGSLQSFLIFLTTGAAGPLYDAGYYRHILVVGSGTIVLGTFLQSISTRYWHFILTQSICVGLGGGLISFLGPTILATYFNRHLALASGIGASGGGVAGIVFPFVFRELQPQLGFGWTVRVMGFISLATLAVPVFAMKVHMFPSRIRHMVDTTAFRDIPFIVFLFGNFLLLLGVFIPYFYVQAFAIDTSLAGRELSFYVLGAMNLASVFGRILPNFLSAVIGPFNMFLCMALVATTAAFAYIAATSLAGLIVTSIFYGFSSGGVFALQPVVVIGLCPDSRLIGTRVGMAFCFLAFAVLASNPLAGAILDSGGYTGVWLWTGAVLGIGGLVMAVALGVKYGWTLAHRV